MKTEYNPPADQLLPPLQVVPTLVIRASPPGFIGTTYFSVELDISHVPAKCRLVLSGEPSANAGLIYDDTLTVNGFKYENGFTLDAFHPEQHLEEDPVGIYSFPTPDWIDITDRRSTTHNRLRIELSDYGEFYCSSAIFLRFLRPNENA